EAHLLACVEALRLAQIPVGPELGSTTRRDHFQPLAHEPDRGRMAGRRSAVEIDALPISAHQGAGVGPRSEVEAGVEKASQALADGRDAERLLLDTVEVDGTKQGQIAV